MKIRELPFAAIVSAVFALGCSGRVNADAADAGTPHGGAGSGGMTVSTGGTSSGGSAGAAGRVSTGGAGTGGAPAGGSAGGGAGEASCRACPPPPPPPADAGPISCGAETCSSNEVCVQPAYNSCGPQPLCVTELDGGGCPSGTMFAQFCNGSSSGGCVEIPKPGPPHCAPMPSSCGSNPSCGCLPHDVCGPSGVDVCSAVHERHVDCLCTAA